MIQRIFVLFSNSTKRWKVLLDNVPNMTVKSLSNTRWEARVKSIKALRFQAPQVRKALLELYNICDDAKSKSESESLASMIESFEFILGMVIWYEILFAINMVSKKMQSSSMCIDSAINQLESLIAFFEKFRIDGFVSSLIIANDIACEMDIDPVFSTKRVKKIPRKYFDDNTSNVEQQSPEESFRINYFLVLVDMSLASLKHRFEQLNEFNDLFGFLMNSGKLKALNESKLKEKCSTFCNVFSHEGTCDVNLSDLFSELKILQVALPSLDMPAAEILDFVMSIDCYPNVSIVYRILLTLPVTVASAERSFSKLKLLKNYLRSSMSQDRLNGLAILCIEKDFLEYIDYDTIINDFASKNARRSHFR